MLERLKQLVSPPQLPFVVPPIYDEPPYGFSHTWEAAEELLGVSFPDDHKQVVECYGDGIWGGSLVLIAPRFSNQYRNTIEIATHSHLFKPNADPLSDDEHYLKAFRDCQSAACEIHSASPAMFYPISPGLLPLGYLSDNYLGLNPDGCYLFWSTSQEREIVVLSNNLTFNTHRHGLCSFLIEVFNGSIDLGLTFDATRGFESYWGPRNAEESG